MTDTFAAKLKIDRSLGYERYSLMLELRLCLDHDHPSKYFLQVNEKNYIKFGESDGFY